VRLDYCFHLPEHARKFFKAVHKLTDSLHSIPKMVTCILLSEEELGYQHEPVLTENDLLAIQSPEYCRNIFRTSVVMRVKMKEDTVVYEFRNVTDVNRFLYNKSSSVKTRSLGLLRKNVVPKVIEMDKGFYRLYSAGPKIPDIIGEKHRFKVNGPYLLFSSKLDLFAFLVSEDAAGIDHLQFDDKYIIDVRKPSNSEIESKVKVDILKACDNSSNASGSNNLSEVGGEVDRESAIQNVDMKMKQCKDITIEQVVKGNSVDFEGIELSEHDKPLSSSNEASKLWKVCEVKTPEDLKSKNIEGPGIGGILGLEYETSLNSEKEVNIASNEEGNDISTMTKELKIASSSSEESKLKSALLQKDEQIQILKRKLLIKEKMLQTQIMEKNAANISHKQVLSQLEEINRLSSIKCEK